MERHRPGTKQAHRSSHNRDYWAWYAKGLAVNTNSVAGNEGYFTSREVFKISPVIGGIWQLSFVTLSLSHLGFGGKWRHPTSNRSRRSITSLMWRTCYLCTPNQPR